MSAAVVWAAFGRGFVRGLVGSPSVLRPRRRVVETSAPTCTVLHRPAPSCDDRRRDDAWERHELRWGWQ